MAAIAKRVAVTNSVVIKQSSGSSKLISNIAISKSNTNQENWDAQMAAAAMHRLPVCVQPTLQADSLHAARAENRTGRAK